MRKLAKVMAELKEAENINDEFRLFLTSMPVQWFPVSILYDSIKYSSEPPKGIKDNLMRSWTEIKDEWFDNCKNPDLLRKLCFGASLFHAIV